MALCTLASPELVPIPMRDPCDPSLFPPCKKPKATMGRAVNMSPCHWLYPTRRLHESNRPYQWLLPLWVYRILIIERQRHMKVKDPNLLSWNSYIHSQLFHKPKPYQEYHALILNHLSKQPLTTQQPSSLCWNSLFFLFLSNPYLFLSSSFAHNLYLLFFFSIYTCLAYTYCLLPLNMYSALCTCHYMYKKSTEIKL